MSASKSDRLGRNPFDRGTYAEAAAPRASKAGTKKSGAKSRKSSKRTRDPAPAWRLLLNELDRRAPQKVRDLKICKRVAALAEFAAERLNAVARHLEA